MRRFQGKLEASQREAKAFHTSREENAALVFRVTNLEGRLRDALAAAAHERAEKNVMAEDAAVAQARVLTWRVL